MRVLSSSRELQDLALAWRAQGREVALIPTMGGLHRGHASLMALARREAGPGGCLVATAFVNRLQFGEAPDFESYPRRLRSDAELCRREGVDVLFAPGSEEEIYPADPPASVRVEETCLSRSMEGACRPGHFRGVATVVAILLNLALPTLAVFGEKDWQQLVVVERLVRDLRFPVRLVAAPTVREEDGLACSSRNALLDPRRRALAPVLWQALEGARRSLAAHGAPMPAGPLKEEARRRVRAVGEARLDYLEIFHPQSLLPADPVGPGDRMALAARLGPVRLIDNLRLG